MTSQGFGAGFPPGGFGGVADSGELAAQARRYWSQWGEMLRSGGQSSPMAGFGGGGLPGAGFGFPGGNTATPTGLPGWNEAVSWWSQLAGGGVPQADATVQRFNAQAQGWYAQIQQLAARFAGQEASAGDVVKAWKDMFGGHGGNPFAEALQGMQGQGQQGFDQWLQQASPWLEKMRNDSSAWLGTPTLGFTREHEQGWKELVQAQQEYQRHSQGYQTLMNEALQDAFKRFEKKLEACSEPGKQLDSMRALFDLWIDAAEEAYADIALSPRFRDAYGELANAQMRLRSSVQKQVEHAADSMGMPTRTEVDAAHRKVTQLQRELRQLRTQLDAMAARDAKQATAKPTPVERVDTAPAAPEPVAPEAAPVAPTAKPAPAATKPAATKPTAAKPTAAKPTAAKPAAATKPVTKASGVSSAAAKKATRTRPAKPVASAPGEKKIASTPVAKKMANPPAAKKAVVAKKPVKNTAASPGPTRVTKPTTKAR